jgi:hypothetical protein
LCAQASEAAETSGGEARTRTGEQLLVDLIRRLCERTSIILNPLAFGGRPGAFADARMITGPLDRLTHPCEIIEAGKDSWRFRNCS